MNLRRAFGSLVPWVLLGAIGWAGLGWLMATMLAADPPKAGFDLNLLLDAARRVSQGASPYVQGQLFDGPGSATDLFYSYPPPVAQALVVVAGLTNARVLVLWAIGATAGLAVVAARLGAGGGLDPRRTAVRAIAVAPFVLPFAVALLFGNLDAWYPLGYGLLLLAVLPGAGRWRLVAGGAALALMAIAKLHPASLIAWVAVRALVERGGPNARILGVTTVVGCLVVALSVAAGGIQPWRDWLDVARAATNLDLVDARNLGPVSLLGLAAGTEGDALRLVQAGIALVAVGLTMLAAWRIRDPVASLAIAVALSLVILPVTWYHYAAALVPFAIVLAIHHPARRPHVAGALVLADLAIGWLPLTWLAVGLLLLAAWRSAPATTTYRRVFA